MGKIKGKPTFGIDNRIGLNLKQDIKTIKEVFGRNLTFGELAKGYIDDSSKGGGVTAWNGKLNLSPKYQRSFVRDGNGKEAKRWRTRLINSIVNGLPIGEIYFATCEDDEKVFQESFEQLDGKQRMMTVLGYINGYFCLDYESERGIQKNVYFEKLKKSFPEIAQKILDYEPVIYVCCGDRESKKEWFDTINQPNSPLTDQEIRNAIYNGTFIDDIKMHFAKTKATAVSTFENNEFLFNEYAEKITYYLIKNDIESLKLLHIELNDKKEIYFNIFNKKFTVFCVPVSMPKLNIVQPIGLLILNPKVFFSFAI